MLFLLEGVALEDFSGFLTHTQHHLNQEYFISDILLSYFSEHNFLIKWFISDRMKPCDFPQIKNGRLHNEERYRPYFPVPVGKRFHYLCNSGFVTASRRYWGFIHCTARGWRPAVPCVRQCVFHKVENGESPYRQIPYSQGESAKVKCYPGYSLPNGQDTVTCTENGWSPQLKCIRVNKVGPCDQPPELLNGEVKGTKKEEYSHDDVVEYVCNPRYLLKGPNKIQCVDGKWTTLPICVGSTGKCGPPPPIDNGDITSFPLPIYAPSSSVEYQCKYLYQLQGNKKITCRNGEWSEPPKCLHPCVISEEIMERHNITLRWIENQKLYIKSGDYAEFQCKSGYRQTNTRPPLRTLCIDGHIDFPSCSIYMINSKDE
uniref:Sushi domain-containing protein n=1 Tax=Peromyscus maniculatus bairdii TaxID=230844 RepID=A0A8C8UKN6_PERMB